MQFKPIIALCDRHTEELKEQLESVPDEVEQSFQEKVVRAGCDAARENPYSCEKANHFFYLDLELTGWRLKKAGAKGGAAKTDAKAAAARANGAKGGRPRKHLKVVSESSE